jgi:hypothetical protein
LQRIAARLAEVYSRLKNLSLLFNFRKIKVQQRTKNLPAPLKGISINAKITGA